MNPESPVRRYPPSTRLVFFFFFVSVSARVSVPFKSEISRPNAAPRENPSLSTYPNATDPPRTQISPTRPSGSSARVSGHTTRTSGSSAEICAEISPSPEPTRTAPQLETRTEVVKSSKLFFSRTSNVAHSMASFVSSSARLCICATRTGPSHTYTTLSASPYPARMDAGFQPCETNVDAKSSWVSGCARSDAFRHERSRERFNAFSFV